MEALTRQPDHRANLRAALMRSMLLTPYEELRELRLAIRVLSVLLAGITSYKLMFEPSLLILTSSSSLIAKAAMLGKHPVQLAVALLASFSVLGLYIVQQIMAPGWMYRRNMAKATVFALLVSSVVWMYLLVASCRMDAGSLPLLLVLNAVCCAGFALALSLALNGELARALEGQE